MGILHRIYTKHAPEVWQVETRLLHAAGRVRRPLAVQWLVTAACDLHCPHCYSEAGKRTAHELSTAEAKRLVIDELVALGCQNLVLAGGELWLRRDIPELIAYAAERGLAWSMHTHGLHVPRFREILAQHPPVLAAISLDAVGKEHDDFRGRVGSYAGALEAIRVLKEVGCPEVVAGTTVTRRNADRLAPLFPVVAESGADAWGLHLFAPEGRGHAHTELVPTKDQLRRVAAFARRKRRSFHVELCNEWGSAGLDDWLYRDQPFLCGAGRVSCVVSPAGEVMPCTTTDPRESEGNVRDVALRDVWATGFGRFRQPRALPGTAEKRRRGRALVWPRKKDGSALAGAPAAASRDRDEEIDEQECWLQSRNGHACSADAFGAPRLPSPTRLLDKLLAHRVATHFRPAGPPRVVSSRAARTLRVAAVATVFLQGCANKIKPTPSPSAAPDPAAETRASVEGPASAAPAGSSPVATSTTSATASASAPRPVDAPIAPGPPLSVPAPLAQNLAGHFRHRVGPGVWASSVRRLVAGPPLPSASTPDARARWAESLRAEAQRIDLAEGAKRGQPPGALSAQLRAHIDRLEKEQPDTPTELLALLDAAERSPVYDVAFAAYLFRRTEPANASSAQRRALFARLDAHVRVAEALDKAQQSVGHVELSAWRSKAAPPVDWSDRLTIPAGLLDATREALKTSSAAGFRRHGAVFLRVDEGEVTLHTDRGAELKRKGDAFVLERLFTMTCVARCVVVHPVAGQMHVPAGTEASLYDLPRFLDASAEALLAGLVARAAAGDPSALGKLEAMMALAHRLVRASIQAVPAPPGRAELQMLLSTLDE